MTTTPAGRDVLTQSEAEARAARINSVSYEIDLRLGRQSTEYQGHVVVTFGDTGEGSTFLDLTGKQIDSLTLNDQAIESPEWDGYRLTLPGDLLAAENRLEIDYTNEYDTTGEGLHRFVDPEDGEVYLYSNFEPFGAHRLFPCFDQPDLKARYQLRVTHPADWEVISNSPESGSEAGEERGDVTTSFAQTNRFSTYLFALIAGPYVGFLDAYGEVKLGFYARRSLSEHVDADELFEVTKQGLAFFGEFFDYPYPFGKYDQIFVPEFNAGAMENVGAVTFSERMVFRDPPTDNQRLGRGEVILHEMAHMWFGDLVTMRWWNDLWLNESFATFMAYLGLVEATRFTTAWQSFNSGMKNWAYRQDQLVTTHPIAGEVEDTDQTFLNFDGITYGKGASVLKQLVAYIGLEGFRNGMRLYFRRHEYGNTTLAEFLAALGEGAGRDLERWAELWLETPSLNTLAAEVERDGDRVSALQVSQTAPADYPTLRPHHVEIALARSEGDAVTIDAVEAEIEAATAEVPEAVGLPAPDFVFPNYNDHDFVKVALDGDSVAFVRERLEAIDDPLLRQLIWQALWNMVRDQQLRSTDYLELGSAKVVGESDPELVETILATMTATVSRYVPEEQKAEAAHALFQLAWDRLPEVDSDLQIIWARTMIGTAINAEDVTRALTLADGDVTVEDLTIDQDMRWSLAASAVALGLPGAPDRVAGEAARDTSDRGQRAQLRCETAVPDAEAKAAAWEKIHGEGYGSLHLTAAAMSGFQWWAQRDLLEPYTERFFEALPGIFRERDNEFARSYAGAMLPGYRVERELLERSRRVLEEAGDELPLLVRSLREANDDLERAIRCREFAAS
jgi:aminopeptidase N